MENKEDILNKLSQIIFRVSGIKIDKMNTSLFSLSYNVKADEMANVLILCQKELGFIITTESVDYCEEFTMNKIADAVLRFNTNSAN